ncbi:fungal-specific transcription factor domain-containing protein [Mariannaea sp. PMI_226]|nr:fungal-specific transcription factor domain-containing protein [Mariannaea sp. PMI_226]
MEIITPLDYQTKARKRQRRSLRPCDACRKRKTRCVIKDGDGDCVHCQLRITACTFQHDPPERHAANSTTSGGVTNGTSGDDRPVSLDESRGKKRSRKESRDDARTLISDTPSIQSSYLSTSETRASGDSGYHPQHSSVVMPELVSGLAGPNPLHGTLGCMTTRFSELYGLGSDMEPILMRHRPYDPVTHEFSQKTHAIRRMLERDEGQEYPVTFHIAGDDKAVDSDPTHSLVESIEDCVRPYGPNLVKLFWRHVQPCYPLLSKEAFATVYSRGYRSIPPALLGTVYLSALRWWTYDPQLSIRTQPNAAVLRDNLQSALMSSYHRPKLCSIQACLLLLQCQPEDPLNPEHAFQWGLTCRALAIGQSLGLHQDAGSWAIPQWERNLRKRLSWALYMQDCWTAVAYGRPLHIHTDDWTVQDLTPEDFTDVDSERYLPTPGPDAIASTGMNQFILMARLTKILAAIYREFYTARTSREQNTVVLFEKARPFFDMLNTWYSSMPPTLQMNVVYRRKLCFHGFLHFSYYGVAMTLLRRLIRSTALPPRCTDDRVLCEIRQIALQTAQSAISFVTSLRPDHLEAFWFFTSPYLFSLLGSFTTLLLVTSLSSQGHHFWQETLNSYLWKLRMMSKSHEPMKYAVNRLEGSILRGLEHALAVNLNESVNDKVRPIMSSYATDVYQYTDFGDWDLAGGVNGAYDILSGIAVQPDPAIIIPPREDIG